MNKHEQLKIAANEGLNLRSLSLLLLLAENPQYGLSRFGDLAYSIGITASAFTQLVDRLVSLGLAQRNDMVADRRLRKVRITKKGIKLLENLNLL